MTMKRSLGGLNWVDTSVSPDNGQNVLTINRVGYMRTVQVTGAWEADVREYGIVAWAPQQDLEIKLLKTFASKPHAKAKN